MDMTYGYDTKEQMDAAEKRSVENNTNTNEHKSKEGSPFQISEVKDGVFP